MKLKIVVIDDEPSIRDTFKWHLEDLGHEVLTFAEPGVCDVYQGGLCQKTSPCSDALLVDYHMPGMNGLDFIENMVKSGCHGNPENVILMSGDTSRIDMDRVKKLGCRVVQKPLSLSVLEDWIEQVKLRRKAAEDAE